MCPTRETKVGVCAFKPKAHAPKYTLSRSQVVPKADRKFNA